jgi:hypothetical protein
LHFHFLWPAENLRSAGGIHDLGRANYLFIIVVISYDTAATAHWTLISSSVPLSITPSPLQSGHVLVFICNTMPWPKKLRNQGSGISSTGKIFMSFGTLT